MVASSRACGVFLVGICGGNRAAWRGGNGKMTHLPTIDVAVVEDDRSLRESTSRLLRLLGYATASFASAEDFLSSGRVRDTSCLITDVHLPGMSGVDLQSRLTSDGHRIPVIFITGFPDEAVRARVLSRGALCYLCKPLEQQSLIAWLDRALKDAGPDPS